MILPLCILSFACSSGIAVMLLAVNDLICDYEAEKRHIRDEAHQEEYSKERRKT